MSKEEIIRAIVAIIKRCSSEDALMDILIHAIKVAK